MSKVLHEASVVFRVIQEENGAVQLSAGIMSEEVNGAHLSSMASAAALAAASAFALFANGQLLKDIEMRFGVDLNSDAQRVVVEPEAGVANGAAA